MKSCVYLNAILALMLTGCGTRHREVVIHIQRDGVYFVDGARCDRVSLKDTLPNNINGGGDVSVRFVCGGDLNFGVVQTAMEQAMQVGIWDFSLQMASNGPPARCPRPAVDPNGPPVIPVRIHVYLERLTVNGTNATLSSLEARLKDKVAQADYRVLVMPETNTTVAQVYAVLRTCETNSVAPRMCFSDESRLPNPDRPHPSP
jgi:biopolymer transport protein ExbD